MKKKIVQIFLLFFFILFPHKNISEQPKFIVNHIILFIGDGMHLQHEIAASRYLYGTDYGLCWHRFKERYPVSTWDITTYNNYAKLQNLPEYNPANFNPLIGYDPKKGGNFPFPLDFHISEDYFLNPCFATDSASAATAISTGYKTENGKIAWAYGNKLKTIAEILREKKGFSIGIVSTVPFSHATPAAFVSHNISRENYYEIAEEIIKKTKPELVIGGGHPDWDKRYISDSLYKELKNGNIKDYIFVERIKGVDGSLSLINAVEKALKKNKKLFGLFGGKGGNFEPPLVEDNPGEPKIKKATVENPLLKDATLAALKILSRDKDGFFLMVEAGDIDWANHANNYKWMIGSMWDLEEAVKATISFVENPHDKIDWTNTLLIVTSDHANSYMRLTNNPVLEKGDLPLQIGVDYMWKYPEGEVIYKTNGHTNELVMLYANGEATKLFKKYKGAWYPNTEIIDNTQIFKIIWESANIF